MNDHRIENWEKAKYTREKAEDWQNLPKGQKYRQDTFEISTAHCKAPTLCRAGQQSCGGQNYWETGKEFNQAILEYLVSDWDNVWPKVHEILKEKERSALEDCQSFVNEMQALIDGKAEE